MRARKEKPKSCSKGHDNFRLSKGNSWVCRDCHNAYQREARKNDLKQKFVFGVFNLGDGPMPI